MKQAERIRKVNRKMEQRSSARVSKGKQWGSHSTALSYPEVVYVYIRGAVRCWRWRYNCNGIQWLSHRPLLEQLRPMWYCSCEEEEEDEEEEEEDEEEEEEEEEEDEEEVSCAYEPKAPPSIN